MGKNLPGALWLDYFVMQKGEKAISNYGNIFCQFALMECCQGKSLIIKECISVNVTFFFVHLLREWLVSFHEKGTAELIIKHSLPMGPC